MPPTWTPSHPPTLVNYTPSPPLTHLLLSLMPLYSAPLQFCNPPWPVASLPREKTMNHCYRSIHLIDLLPRDNPYCGHWMNRIFVRGYGWPMWVACWMRGELWIVWEPCCWCGEWVGCDVWWNERHWDYCSSWQMLLHPSSSRWSPWKDPHYSCSCSCMIVVETLETVHACWEERGWKMVIFPMQWWSWENKWSAAGSTALFSWFR